MSGRSLDTQLRHAAEAVGTPCYVYILPSIEARIALIARSFAGRFVLSFAVKSNPNPALLAWMAGRIDHLDVSSIGEFRLACQAGWPARKLSFTGPGKREAEIREACATGVGQLVIESIREAAIANRCAAELGSVQDILVRIAPEHVPKGFGDQMAGRPVAFGIDWERIDSELPVILAMPHLRLTGLHIYSGTQCRNAAAIVANYRIFIELFRSTCDRYGITPAMLVFGSGIGIPYHDGDAPVDLAAVAEAMGGDLDALLAEPRFTNTKLVLELGRYLVGEAGFFLTRVVSIKESRGTRIAICDGGMNNHLPASGHFGMVVRRNYAMHKVAGGDGQMAGPREKIDLVGPLCTSIDRLATAVDLPRIDAGDIVAIHASGAYGLTASPIHFISHAAPYEVLADAGGIRDVTRLFDGRATDACIGRDTLRVAAAREPLLPNR